MTDEQIKQNAEEYAKKIYPYTVGKAAAIRGFIAGAHSLDGEIEELQNELESLRKGFYEQGNKLKELIKKLMLANNKLRNPWISVKEQLPEENPDDKGYSVEVIGMFQDESVSKCFCSIEDGIWFIEGLTCDKPTHWMPIPELKNGE